MQSGTRISEILTFVQAKDCLVVFMDHHVEQERCDTMNEVIHRDLSNFVVEN